MNIGKMNMRIEIILPTSVTDSEGFSAVNDVVVANVRAAREEKLSEAAVNSATAAVSKTVFTMRKIPNVDITTDNIIVCCDRRYNIISVDNCKGHGMYVTVTAENAL
jgi:SPP1 family predicted phage head-tail adaptor